MVDSTPLYEEPIHPVARWMNKAFTREAKPRMRTVHPVRYYYIDFGLTQRYDPKDGPPRSPIGYGGDLTVPEFDIGVADCDPFPVDIYRLGNFIREYFLDVCPPSSPVSCDRCLFMKSRRAILGRQNLVLVS